MTTPDFNSYLLGLEDRILTLEKFVNTFTVAPSIPTVATPPVAEVEPNPTPPTPVVTQPVIETEPSSPQGSHVPEVDYSAENPTTPSETSAI